MRMINKISIYADHAATTPLLPKAFEVMLPYFQTGFGNPSRSYTRGIKTREAVTEARKKIARCICSAPDEIYFTSGGTESNNWALAGVTKALHNKGKHIVTSSIEHHAVLNCCKALEEDGYEVTYLPVTPTGKIEVEALDRALRKDTLLVSIMLANNEIGTIQDIAALAKIAHNHGVLFHTDAVQAVGHISVDVKRLGIDLLSASAHKFNGSQGCGFLYVKSGTPIRPFHKGGQQEQGLRAGTENVPGIVGMAVALEHHVCNFCGNQRRLRTLAERFKDIVLQGCPKVVFNGDFKCHLPGHISVSFPGCDGEALMHILDLKGICVSTGAACNSQSTEISHVLRAIDLEETSARGTLRITLGNENTLQEVITIANSIVEIVRKIIPQEKEK